MTTEPKGHPTNVTVAGELDSYDLTIFEVRWSDATTSYSVELEGRSLTPDEPFDHKPSDAELECLIAEHEADEFDIDRDHEFEREG